MVMSTIEFYHSCRICRIFYALFLLKSLINYIQNGHVHVLPRLFISTVNIAVHE